MSREAVKPVVSVSVERRLSWLCVCVCAWEVVMVVRGLGGRKPKGEKGKEKKRKEKKKKWKIEKRKRGQWGMVRKCQRLWKWCSIQLWEFESSKDCVFFFSPFSNSVHVPMLQPFASAPQPLRFNRTWENDKSPKWYRIKKPLPWTIDAYK